MNILHKLARESLRKNRARTLVTILGVVLSAALITGVCSFGYSLLRTLAEATALRCGDWHLAVENVDAAFLSQQEENAELARVIAFDELGTVSIPSSETALRLVGFTEDSFDQLPLIVLSGRLPRTPQELLLQEGADAGGVGDAVSLLTEDGTREDYAIVGVCVRPAFGNGDTHGLFAVTRIERLRDDAEKTVFLKLRNPYSIRSFRADIAQDSYYNSKLLRYMGIWDNRQESLIVTLMLSVSIVVIGIVMIGSILLICNAFRISLNERIHQIGLLASVGATPKQLRRSVLYEGLCIGAVGIPIGALTGLGAISVVIAATAENFSDLFPMAIHLRMRLSLPILLVAVLVSLVTILISAYLPAKKASAVPVIECIRQTGEIRHSAKAVRTTRLSETLFGFEGTLALKNFKRNRRQYRSVILSLVLSIVLFVSTSTCTTCLTDIAEDSEMVTDYEVGFGTTELDDAALLSLYEKCDALSPVSSRRLQAVYALPVTVDGSAYTASVQFIDEEGYSAFQTRCGLTGDALPTLAKRNDADADSIEELPDLFSGDACTAELCGQTLSLACVEELMPDIPPHSSVADALPYTLQILAPWSLRQALAPAEGLRVKGITVATEASAQVKTQLQSLVEAEGVRGSYILIDCREILNSNNSLVFLANLFSYTFIVMVTLIAAANVFNTISTNIRLRRRELAMIRSVGMDDRSFRRMMRFECVFYGLRAMLFGLPISLGLSYLIQKLIANGQLGGTWIPFDVPWLPIAVSIAGVLCMIFVTMMYTVNRLRGENVIDALRDEMT